MTKEKNNKNGWTEERRKKQAETIRRHRPWEKSTGPKTPEGKKAVRLNAIKHGQYRAMIKTYRDVLRLNREFLAQADLVFQYEEDQREFLNKLLEKNTKSLKQLRAHAPMDKNEGSN